MKTYQITPLKEEIEWASQAFITPLQEDLPYAFKRGAQVAFGIIADRLHHATQLGTEDFLTEVHNLITEMKQMQPKIYNHGNDKHNQETKNIG